MSFFQFSLMAQIEELNDDGGNHLVRDSRPVDFYVPINSSYNAITFEIVGADGGSAAIADCKSAGGQGATTTLSIFIGTNPGQIAPGNYVRFMTGVSGRDNRISNTLGTGFSSGGGGGGSAVLISSNQVDWEILAVAGGGGGAYQGGVFSGCVDSQAGQGGRSTSSGGNGAGSNSGDGGTNGNGGDGGGTNGTGDLSGGGGGAFSNGGGNFSKEGKAGFPNGGAGGTVPAASFGTDGGWGFGGGGAGEDAPGGGGGYSGGGGGGEINNGGGGGSYTNPEYAINPVIISGGTTGGTTLNGSAFYQFENICLPSITGFSYINPLCAPDDQGRIQLDYTLTGGSNCGSQLQWSLEPLNGWQHLGDGLFRSMRAGTYTASVKNTSIDAVVATYTFTVGVTNEAPKAVCKNITVDLTNGTYSNADLANLIDGGSTGPCDPVLTASKTNFDCSNLGNNAVTLTSTGSHNLSSSCQANVRVQLSSDEQAVAKCKTGPSFNLDGGTLVLTADDINDGSSLGGCSNSSSMSISPSTFDCTMLGSNVVTLTVGSGQNVVTCSSTITITDNDTPTASCKNSVSVILVDGNVSIDYTEVDNGSLSNNCTNLTYELSQSDFDCNHMGTNEVILTITDDRNNQSNCATTVNVFDNTNPVAVCRDISIALDENGSYTLAPIELDGGSIDQCNLAFTASQTVFDCEDIGVKEITLTATDPQDHESNCTAKVTVEDDLGPVIARCQDLTLQLSGESITFAHYKTQYFQEVSDNCGIASIDFIGSTTLTCADVGVNERGLEAIDDSGNRTTCSFNVTVQDNTPPQAMCQDITVQLDANGIVFINIDDVDNGSYDDCGIALINLDQTTSINCQDIGILTVTLAMRDFSGNQASCQAAVTVQDNIEPQAICQDVTVQLDVDGNASITAADIDNGSNDACGIASLNLDKTEFSCDELGNNTVMLTATDGSGNASSCQAIVQVVDQTGPTIDCTDTEVYLDQNGIAEISATSLIDDSFDACGIAKYEVDRTSFSCQDLGSHQLTATVTDNNGNASTCQASVRVFDGVDPIANCQDVTIQLGIDGTASLSPQQVDGGSSDNCSIKDRALDQSQFDCSNIGENTVTLDIEDRGGNSDYCQATVTVVDQIGPTLDCSEYEVALDENGSAEITPTNLLNLAFDACGIASVEISRTTFSCQDFGDQSVTLSATDNHGNTSTCQMIVYVFEEIRPTALCKDATIQLDANGMATLTVEQIDNGSYDNCSLQGLFIDQTQFDCSNIGENTVTLEVDDSQDYSSDCQATVTVVDALAPVALCQNITVQLDEQGQASITAADINNGSNDACGIATMSLDQTSFTCDQTGDNTVTLNVTDNNENSGNCQATVTVVDEIAPTLSCQQHMTVNTDQGECGANVILPKAVASDNCGLTSLRSRYRPIDENEDPIGEFSAWADDHSGFFEAGSFEIQWKAGDGANSYSYCVLILDVIDEEAPAVICKDVTINFNGEETIAIPTSSIFDEGASFDACGTVSFVNQSLGEVSCDEVGETVNVQVIGIDPNGNTGSCTAQVAVVGMPCGFEATDIDCEQGAAADYDPIEDSYTLEADDCSGYPQGEFSFVGTRLCGDGEITVKVSDLMGDGRAGVVMMESTDPGARRVSMLKSQTRQVTTEYRASTNGSLRQKHKNRSGVEWVRIVRIGNKFKTYTSTNGSSWKHAHTINFSNFADCVHAGIMTYSRRSYDPVTATFDQLSVVSYSSTALAALPTGTSAAMEDVTEQSSDNYFPSNDLVLEVAPNPFSDQTQIEFELPQEAEVTLEIYNLQGQRVKQLIAAQLLGGIHQEMWTGTDAKGQVMPTGVYLLRLQVGQRSLSKKISLIRN